MVDFPNKADGPKQIGPGTPVPPKEKKEPIVSDSAQKVKRPASRRLMDFVRSENPKAMGAQVGRDVFLPQLKMAFEAACNAFLSNALWGGNTANRPGSNLVQRPMFRSQMSHQPYSVISTHQNQQAITAQVNQALVQPRSSGNYEDLVYKTPQDAQKIYAQMLDYLSQYPVVTVGDLYEWSDVLTSPSDNSFGWVSLDGARIVPGRGGFILELPRPTLV